MTPDTFDEPTMRTSTLFALLAIVTLSVAAMGCSDDVSGNDDGGFNITEPGTNNGNGEPPEVNFVLDNQLGTDVYVQHAVEPGPGWLSVLFEEDPIHIRWDCMLPCECPDADDPDSPISCMDCGMMAPYTAELDSGDHISHTWDGLEYRVTDGCFEKLQRTDEHMQAEFCWSLETTDGEFEDYLVDPTCETADFELGVDDEVVVTIEEEEAPHPVEPDIDFVLENSTDAPIYVQHGTYHAPSWLDVVLDDESVYITWDCGMPCPCDDDHPQGCMVCGMPLPWVETIEPDDDLTFSWDGVQYAIVDEDADICFDEVLMGRESMSATFCYGFDYSGDGEEFDGEYVEDAVCESIDFELTVDGEVRHIVH